MQRKPSNWISSSERRPTGASCSSRLRVRSSSPPTPRRSAFVRPGDTDSVSSPRKITKNLAATRIENASLRDRLNSHELEVKRRDRIIGQLEQQVLETTEKLKQTEKDLAMTKEKARVDSSQTSLLRQEIDMLKRHLVRSHLIADARCLD